MSSYQEVVRLAEQLGLGEHKITMRSRGHIERLQEMIDAVAAR
jgi:predicted deacetylase